MLKLEQKESVLYILFPTGFGKKFNKIISKLSLYKGNG